MARSKFRFVSEVLLVSVVFLFAGCATIMHGTTQNISFSSSPGGANVRVNGMPRGETPVIVDLKRNRNHTVSFNLEGYESYKMNITNSLSGWVWGNIIFGGLVGLAVDAATGGLYKLTPEQVYAQLETRRSEYDDGQLYIAVTLQPNNNWEKIGNLKAASTN